LVIVLYGELDPGSMLVEAMKIMFDRELINLRGGNGSVRLDERRILITPSGLPKNKLKPGDLVLYDIVSGTYTGIHKPSIEAVVHAKIYTKNSSVGAILHAHPPLTLALTTAGASEWWNADLVEVQYSIGSVEVVEPAPPGSQELADRVAEAVSRGARVVIVPKHGVFACAATVWETLDAIIALEDVAKYMVAVLMLRKFREK